MKLLLFYYAYAIINLSSEVEVNSFIWSIITTRVNHFPGRETLSKTFGTLLLIVLGLLVLVTAWQADDANSATHNPRNFVTFKMTSTDKDYSDGSVDVQLAVRSATDMPVPGVTVVLGLCQFGQQVPFRLATRTRHLVPGQESLRAFNGGRNIEWKLASAPANTGPFQVLNLKLSLPVNKGGPTFCVTGAASTPYDTAPAVLRRLEWKLK